MPSVFTSERRVEFCETDAAGIAHFSSLIVYMEQAEHALLRSLGLSVALTCTSQFNNDSSQEPAVSWPRVKVECEFQAPARFEDLLVIETSVAALGTKSVTYQHRILSGGNSIATGKMTCVCCTSQGDSLASVPIPTRIRELLQTKLCSN
jgi:4-hydroxybenzoyl-CoA thioesterase/acyl-CoA thioester hydrolase